MPRPAPMNSKDIKRLNGIFRVFSSLGLSPLLKSLNINVPWLIRLKESCSRQPKETVECRFRLALEKLGPTFIKLGQMLSNRPDIMPDNFIVELEKLRDSVTPIDFKTFKDNLEKELQQPLKSVINHIEETPLATASLAQVHRATLLTGEDVVIKLQRPNIKQHIFTDLRLIEWLIEFVLWRNPQLQQFQPRMMLKELAIALFQELNFKNEILNSQKFRTLFKDNENVIIPAFFSEFSTPQLNIQEKISGIPASQPQQLKKQNWILEDNAKTLCSAIIKMVFKYRIFHPDLHPGNILILPEGKIALVDFGSLGTLTHTRKLQLLRFVESIITRNETKLAKVLLKWNKKNNIDFDNLLILSNKFISKHQNLPMDHQGFSTIIFDFLVILRYAEATPPSDLILLLKTLSSLDTLLYSTLEAQFDFFDFIQPYIIPEITQQHAPDAIAEEAKESLFALTEFRDDAQQILKRFQSDLSQGRPFFKVDVPRLQSFINILDKLASRLSLALIASSLIIGTAIINTIDKGELIYGLPKFGFYSFIGASLIGVWVIISIIRGSKSAKLEDIVSKENDPQ